jgi:hypothetical protein
LPIDDDRESDGEEADENDHMLANRPPDRGRSHDRKGSSRKSTTLSPLFALGPVLASLLGPKSATPTIEECEVRLAQIGSEIRNAQIMFDDTTNGEVRWACRQRISKLADERRFHQIVHERHRIQTMWETTMVESVRVACQERLRQLISELESLRASGGEDAGARDASGNGPVRDLTDVGDMDGEWYDRVLEYVGGAEATQDKMPRMSSEGRANCHLDGGRRHERSTRQDFLSTPQQRGQHGHRGEGSYRESDYVSVSHEHLSPQSDAACVRNIPPVSPPRRGGGRVIRHPVAYAVKSRTSCIG